MKRHCEPSPSKGDGNMAEAIMAIAKIEKRFIAFSNNGVDAEEAARKKAAPFKEQEGISIWIKVSTHNYLSD